MFVKPGYKTTEFLLTLAGAVGAIAAALADALPAKYAAIAIAVSVAAYSLSRGQAKKPAVVATSVTPAQVTEVAQVTPAPVQ